MIEIDARDTIYSIKDAYLSLGTSLCAEEERNKASADGKSN
jgi:hypothetical protein